MQTVQLLFAAAEGKLGSTVAAPHDAVEVVFVEAAALETVENCCLDCWEQPYEPPYLTNTQDHFVSTPKSNRYGR